MAPRAGDRLLRRLCSRAPSIYETPGRVNLTGQSLACVQELLSAFRLLRHQPPHPVQGPIYCGPGVPVKLEHELIV